MVRCICNCICDNKIKALLSQDTSLTKEEVIKELCIGTSCGICLNDIEIEISKMKEEICQKN